MTQEFFLGGMHIQCFFAMEIKNTIQRDSIFVENASGQNPNKRELAKEKTDTARQQLFWPLLLSTFGNCTTSLPQLHFFAGSMFSVFQGFVNHGSWINFKSKMGNCVAFSELECLASQKLNYL